MSHWAREQPDSFATPELRHRAVGAVLARIPDIPDRIDVVCYCLLLEECRELSDLRRISRRQICDFAGIAISVIQLPRLIGWVRLIEFPGVEPVRSDDRPPKLEMLRGTHEAALNNLRAS